MHRKSLIVISSLPHTDDCKQEKDQDEATELFLQVGMNHNEGYGQESHWSEQELILIINKTKRTRGVKMMVSKSGSLGQGSDGPSKVLSIRSGTNRFEVHHSCLPSTTQH